ncbi:MAG: phosphotransferase enzyme family protein [Bacteroidota bacterium]
MKKVFIHQAFGIRMDLQLKAIVDLFDIEGIVSDIHPFGSGHINDSYRVVNSEAGCPDYFLQRINHHVFKDVEDMMQNILSVTEYLSGIYQKRVPTERNEVLTIVRTKDGGLYAKINDQYWRLYLLIEGLKSIDKPDSNQMIYEGAKGFGQFVADLSAFEADSLVDTIPNFHHMPKRLNRFWEVIGSKTDFTREEWFGVDFINNHGEELCKLQSLLEDGTLPLRVTHNDTKFNNILFDQDHKAKCVIDLDTVMPGLVHFDYGDGIRTGTSTSEEDETDLDKVDVDIDAFEAYTHGFLDATREILTSQEIENLVEGALLMPFIMGVRFLTDYFEDNKYYKIAYPNHNLDRARCQLELTRKMLIRKADLVSIVYKYA